MKLLKRSVCQDAEVRGFEAPVIFASLCSLTLSRSLTLKIKLSSMQICKSNHMDRNSPYLLFSLLWQISLSCALWTNQGGLDV